VLPDGGGSRALGTCAEYVRDGATAAPGSAIRCAPSAVRCIYSFYRAFVRNILVQNIFLLSTGFLHRLPHKVDDRYARQTAVVFGDTGAGKSTLLNRSRDHSYKTVLVSWLTHSTRTQSDRGEPHSANKLYARVYCSHRRTTVSVRGSARPGLRSSGTRMHAHTHTHTHTHTYIQTHAQAHIHTNTYS
jgi:hypothetical protein